MRSMTIVAQHRAIGVTPRRWVGRQRSAIPALLASALVALGLLAAGPSPVQSAQTIAAAPGNDGAIVRCDPSTLNASVGATVSVTIFVQDVVDLYGLDVRLVFDPAYAQVVDSDPSATGVQIQPLSGFLSPDFVVRRTADNSTGLVRYAVTQVAPSQPVTGSGAVARIDLRGTQPGAITVPFTNVELVRNNGSAIAATTQACTWQFSQPRLRYLPLITIRQQPGQYR
jgi:hypothetical protein